MQDMIKIRSKAHQCYFESNPRTFCNAQLSRKLFSGYDDFEIQAE